MPEPYNEVAEILREILATLQRVEGKLDTVAAFARTLEHDREVQRRQMQETTMQMQERNRNP